MKMMEDSYIFSLIVWIEAEKIFSYKIRRVVILILCYNG